MRGIFFWQSNQVHLWDEQEHELRQADEISGYVCLPVTFRDSLNWKIVNCFLVLYLYTYIFLYILYYLYMFLYILVKGIKFLYHLIKYTKKYFIY